MQNTSSNDTREKIILKKENDKKEAGEKFFNENIDRLVNQCKTGGNNAFSYVAIFSFLEGYFRERFPKEFGFSKNNENHITFPGIADTFIKYCKTMISDSNVNEKDVVLNLTDLRIMYGSYDQNNWNSTENTDTNHIRHCFAELKPGTLFFLLTKVKEFFKSQNINIDKLENLANSENIVADKSDIKHLQFFSGSLESFYSDFDDFNKYLEHKELLNSSLKDFLIENFPEKTSSFIPNILSDKKNKLLDTLEECFNSINNKDIDYFKEKENFLTALSTSLDQEISGRDYDKEKIKLNDEQKKLVDDCCDILLPPKKDFVITGAPGTGKTLVLISALLVLHEKHDQNPPLLTFSDSLEKYNEYLCKNYNKSFSKQLGITEYDDENLKLFISEHVQSFEKWLDKKLERSKYPVFKIDTNKGKENFTNKNSEFNQFPEELFELAISDIWPNCKEPTDELKELHNVIENLEEKPDLYVYWKFATQVNENYIKNLGLESREETLIIDEVQDLTKAQLETARKISKKGCLLAGDIFQSIRHQCKNWEDIGINGNDVKELTENYRMSENIQRLGNSYLKKCNGKSYSDSKGKAVPGPKPQLFISSDEQKNEIYTQILSSIKLLLDKCDKSPKDIFIVTPSDREVKKIKQLISKDTSLNDIQIRELKVDKNEEIKFDENKITIGTIDSIKGIDCPIVLLLLNESILERPTETLSNSIYTVINRAMHLLQIFMPESLSESAEPSIENLVTLLRSGDYKEDEIPTWVYKFNPSEIKTLNGEKYLFGKYKCKDEDVEGVIHGKILNKNNPDEIKKFLNYEFHVKIYRKDQEYDELTPVLRNKK